MFLVITFYFILQMKMLSFESRSLANLTNQSSLFRIRFHYQKWFYCVKLLDYVSMSLLTLLQWFRTQSGTFKDGDLQVNKDGIQTVSHSEPGAVSLSFLKTEISLSSLTLLSIRKLKSFCAATTYWSIGQPVEFGWSWSDQSHWQRKQW